MGYLLDTNVVSEPERPKPDENVLQWLDGIDSDDVFLSSLTIGEINKGVVKLPAGKRRAKIQNWLEQTRYRFAGRILPMTEATFLVWGRVYGELQKQGIVRPILDSFFEATAIEHDLILVTRNVRNFKDTQVTILNPWED
ncbi:MAG TPA: type II toxin-antitoxin system VapC family toxin [Pyrinomonadaceae bacterium]|nr:type II toxin-antitoxin system VapC family toxin [Pyrinomonadaceae bacterium]